MERIGLNKVYVFNIMTWCCDVLPKGVKGTLSRASAVE